MMRRRFPRTLGLALAAWLLTAGAAPAQTNLSSLEFSSSPNPVGSGARAMGVGNAFIAIADDATAASWNPAGLYQLELPELSIVGAWYGRSEKYSSSEHPEFDSTQTVDDTNLNYLSAAYPFNLLQRNMIVSLNYQRLYELDKDLNLSLDGLYDFGDGLIDAVGSYRVEQQGGLRTITPAYAIQVTPMFALGLAINFWTEIGSRINGWKQVSHASIEAVDSQTGTVFSSSAVREDKFSKFKAVNVNVGALYELPAAGLTIGAVFKSPFTADADHEYRYYGLADGNINLNEGKETVEIHFPMQYGLGVSYRLSDALTFAGDVFRTEWNDYWIKQRSFTSGDEQVKTSPVSGRPTSETDTIPATHQVHLGAEYLLITAKTVIPLRGGLMYDPEPRDGSTQNVWGLTLGTGISWESISPPYLGDLIFDVAWQLRFAQNIGGAVYGVPGAEMDLLQNKILISAIYHF